MTQKQQQVGVSLRFIITEENKILLTKSKGSDFFFLPGGGLEHGEDIKEAIKRELDEEIGIVVKDFEFVGINETKFVDGDTLHHGIDLVFKLEVEKVITESKEGHIDFFLKDFEELKDLKILPKSLKESLIKWLSNKKTFWSV